MITGARTPFALHLSRLFHSAGHRVLLTDSAEDGIARFTRMKDAFVRTPNARFETKAYEAAILKLIDDWRPDLVLPATEEIFYVAAGLARAGRSGLLFAPPLETLAEAHDKARFAEIAQRLGAGAQENIVLKSKADVAAFAHDPKDFVFKPVWSRFASRVLISPDRAALAAIAPTERDPWLAQTKVTGDELCIYAVAHRGALVALAVYRNLMRAGQGTGICYERVDASPEVRTFVERFATETTWHGQVSFDIIRPASGPIVAIECNPRATSGISLFFPGDGLVEAIIDGVPAKRPSRGRVAMKTTAFLVGALSWLGVVPHKPWLRILLPAEDAFWFPGDGIHLIGQIKAVLEVRRVAQRENISILEATTWDMEWNGDDLGEVSAPRAPARERMLTG